MWRCFIFIWRFHLKLGASFMNDLYITFISYENLLRSFNKVYSTTNAKECIKVHGLLVFLSFIVCCTCFHSRGVYYANIQTQCAYTQVTCKYITYFLKCNTKCKQVILMLFLNRNKHEDKCIKGEKVKNDLHSRILKTILQ